MACDEFYTLEKDVNAELKHYDFSGRVVYCPCDNYEWSAFAKYFSENYKKLGLRGLICSCYFPLQKNFFEEFRRGFWVEYDGTAWSEKRFFKKGNGDFRSVECAALAKRADCIVTNPPFSLFTDFFFWVVQKDFVVMFPQTAITQRMIFPYFARRDVWLGKSIRTHGRLFRVPDYFTLRDAKHSRVRGGVKFCEVDVARWVTNMVEFKEKDLDLTEFYQPARYPKFDQLDAINVNKKGEIPRDYYGRMGVPLSFMNYWNPTQFDVLECHSKLTVNGVMKNTRIIIKRRQT